MTTNESRQSVTISCGTTALTTLPDALLDDDTISPMAKMAYWYLKRSAGQYRVTMLDLAVTLHVKTFEVPELLNRLGRSGWIGGQSPESYEDPIRVTVHEVPAVKR